MNEGEKLNYSIEDSTIAELLGKQNFTSKESAIYELIKNSFDANAKECTLSIDKNQICISDNGDGMDIDIIRGKWMHVGKSDKPYKDITTNRVLAGSKGIGRFALARLGNNVSLESKGKNSPSVSWSTDWNSTTVVESDEKSTNGTLITINNLRDNWRKKDVEKLVNFLCRSYISEQMTILIKYKGENFTVEPIVKKLKLGVHYTNEISLYYDNKKSKLSIHVINDELKDEAQEIVGDINIKGINDEINVYDALYKKDKDEDFEYLSGDFSEKLYELGSFTSKLYFGVSPQKLSAENYLYKYDKLSPELSFGIILYRNNFSISSFEGYKDWLDIENRSRKSPAAASHLTGAWRVRRNQINGYVLIDKNNNSNLVDLSNRQGLEENEYYELLNEIVKLGLKTFERYRQSMFRKISEYNKKIEAEKTNEFESKKDNLKELLSNPESIDKFTKNDMKDLSSSIKLYMKELDESEKSLKIEKENFTYESRILNILATQGLKANSVAHEHYNNNNFITTWYQNVTEALKEFGYWDDLNSSEKTDKSFYNVPEILNKTNTITGDLSKVLQNMLEKIERQSFSEPIGEIEETIEEIIKEWKDEYNWVEIDLELINQERYNNNIYKDVLNVIFDNLILNSIQHNDDLSALNIKIEIRFDVNKISVDYSDNGVGLQMKYKKNPYHILDVHETSRSDGHGLGMWMINTTLVRNKGKVNNIKTDGGFGITFDFKV